MYQNTINALPDEFPWKWVLLYVILRGLGSFMSDIRDCIFIKVQNYATKSIGLTTFEHVQNLSLSFHLSRNTGALLRTMDRGKSAITTLLSTLGFVIGPTIFEIILTCGVLIFSYGGWYALMTLVALIGYMVWTFAFTEWRTKFRRELNNMENESSNTALDSLLNFETVRYFTAEKNEVKRYENALDKYFDVSVTSQYTLSILNAGQMVIIALGLMANMLLASHQIKEGKLSVGDLVAINAYVLQLYAPLGWLGTSYRMIVSSFTDMESLFDLLEEKPDVSDKPDAETLRIDRGTAQIEFKNVSFTYPSRSNDKQRKKTSGPTLQNVSFTIPAGKTLAVVGHSGSGKTTIARLLCRFYDPDSGSVSINGMDLTNVTQRSLRREIGVVPQDTVLFNDTIYFNIEFGMIDKVSTTRMTVEEAAKQAEIHDFVMSTADGYQTKVGERGLRLSGGEKQRVAIARTILKDPSILLLDEATSALDSKTEKEIQASLMEVAKGRTTLIVAHRLSTIVDSDEIIVMKKGEIIERGNHSELLGLNGEYKQMWEIQAKEAAKILSETTPENASKEELVDVS
eukprot:TRINITY_DN2663_c0_g1_i1.p1 TRINITY_DN2663_c0_g1~~TRINITY_DN2663_c0_g1_i1.p1  ORF type:complete len:656 (+),score=173.45 TRINITY_DN2663_c0_g1_i1:256-1968(+)